jgi:hypothetical protein
MGTEATVVTDAPRDHDENWPDMGWRVFNTKFDPEGTLEYNQNPDFSE